MSKLLEIVRFRMVVMAAAIALASIAAALSTGEANATHTPSDRLVSNQPKPAIKWTSRFLYEDNLAWASRRDLTSQQFSQSFDHYRDGGFMLVDVDARPVGRSARYSMVWHENPDGRRWAVHRDLTSEKYEDLWENYRAKGYRPLDVEAYTINGSPRYAGIWIENKEGLDWKSRRGMTSAEYGDYFARWQAAGYRPIDIEVYPTGSGLRVAAIWHKNVDGSKWAQLRNLDRDAYQQEVNERSSDGYLMVDYESYKGSNGQLYAAIWEKPAKPTASMVRTNRSALGFANLWRQYRDEGYRMADFENYDTANNALYGGIWIENSDRYGYAKKDELDAAIQDYREENAIPGISVAVIRDGHLIYRRGFGNADKNGPKVAHGETVYGAASVSKVIGGTLAAKLEDEGVLRDGKTFALDLSDPTSDYLANLPNHHTHQVNQLTAHLGCVAHYNTTPSIPNQTTHYATATAAAESIWDTPLVNSCTVGEDRNYSTPAFTLLGAALEQATGRSLNRLLEEELFDPYGLDSMRIQWETANLPPNYERAVPYTSSGNPTTYSDNSWKVLGGGIETNAVDLVRFGQLVLNGKIVNSNARDNRLWTPVDSTCSAPGGGTCRNGIGWELRTQDGRRTAVHDGLATGVRADLRVYRDDGLVIAILSNEHSHNPASLSTTIADVVLAP